MVIQTVKSGKEVVKGYHRRKSTVFKKAKELSTLCNVDVLLMLYGPTQEQNPEIWCNKSDYNTLINKYLDVKKQHLNCKNNNTHHYPEEQQAASSRHEFLSTLDFEGLIELVGDLEGKIDFVIQRINKLRRDKGKGLIDQEVAMISNDSGSIDEIRVSEGKFDSMNERNYHMWGYKYDMSLTDKEDDRIIGSIDETEVLEVNSDLVNESNNQYNCNSNSNYGIDYNDNDVIFIDEDVMIITRSF